VKLVVSIVSAIVVAMMLSACSPKVGSKEWCAAMKEKPRGEWTSNEIRDYAEHCLFK